MAENDILGISAHLDFNDIQKSIDQLVNGLDKIGLKTDVLSKRMNDAMNEIARSTDDTATKNKKAMDVFAQGIAEAKLALEKYPEALRKAKNEADATEIALGKLGEKLTKQKEQFSSVEEGTKKYEKLKNEIAQTEQQIHSNNIAHQAQLTTIQEMEAGYSQLVAMYNMGTIATGANAAAHGTVAVAVGSEAAVHTKNAAEITKESEALEKNKEAIEDVEKTLQSAPYANTPIGAQISEIEERIASLKTKNEQLNASLASGLGDKAQLDEMQQRLDQNIESITKAEAEVERLKDIATMGFKSVEEYEKKQAEVASQVKPEAAKEYWEGVAEIGKKAQAYYDALPALLERIKGLLKEIDETPQNASYLGEMQSLVTQLSSVTSSKDFLNHGEAERGLSALVDKFEKLSDEELKLQRMAENDPWKVQGLSIDELKQRIAESEEKQKKLNEELEKMKSKKGYSEKSKEVEELKLKIATAKKEQELLNKELEGRPGYQKFFNNLREGFKNLGQNIKNTFSTIKTSFTGGEGGISGIFKLVTSGKFLGWTAAIAAIGGSIKGLSDSAESLKKALDPLRSYLDDDVLGKLRQSFIDAALAGSVQSTEDMAAAALKWIKAYEGLRNVPEAIDHVVEASRELATITNTSAEKAAETMTKLGGQFHLTAEEAARSVNILVNAAHESTVSVEELMSALVSSGSRVNMNGATLKEYAAAISLTTAQYGSASQAASAYQSILQRLSTETKDEFNPKVVGATEAFKNLHKAMENGEDLHKKFGKMLWSQAQYFIKNADEIANYTKELDDATEKREELSRKEEEAETHQKKLENALSALAQSINLNLTPAFTTVVDKITSFISILGKAIKLADKGANKIFSFFGFKNPFSSGGDQWDEKNARERYRELLREKGDIIAAQMAIGDEYNASNKPSLSRKDLTKIVEEENAKWKTAHPALSTKTKGNDEKDETDITDPKTLNVAEQRAKKEEDLAKRRRKYEREQAQQRIAALRAEEQAVIAEMQDGSTKEMRQLKLDHQKRMDEIERQRQQMLEKNIEYAATEYDKKRKKGAKGFYTLGLDKNVSLTADQERELKAQEKIAEENLKKQINKEAEERENAMMEFLKKYGSVQAQKAAISKEYDKKIEKARTEAQKASLAEEKKRLIEELNIKELTQNIDWETIFNNIDRLTTEALKKIRDNLRAQLEDGNISPENAAVLSERLLVIENKIAEKTNFWASLIPPLQERVRLTNQVLDAERKITSLKNDQADKERELYKLLTDVSGMSEGSVKQKFSAEIQGGDITSIADALGIKEGSDEWQKLQVAMENYRSSLIKTTAAQENLQTLQSMLKKGGKGVFSGIGEILTNSAESAGGGIAGWMSVINTNAQSMSEFVDKIGIGETEFGKSVHDFADGVGGFSNAIQALLSGDIFGAVNGVIDGVVGLGNALGRPFGLGGADYSGYDKAKEKYDQLSKVWDELISKKRQYLSESWGIEAQKAGDEALKLLAIEKEQNKLLAEQRLGSGSSTGSRSIWYRMWKGSYTSEGRDNLGRLNNGRLASSAGEINWQDVNKAVERGLQNAGLGKVAFNDMYDMLNMTGEQLEWIKENYAGLWAHMDDEFKNALENIIKFGETEKEIIESIRERILGTSFDSVFNSFMSSMYNMADGAKDVEKQMADDWQQMMNKMVLNNIMGEKYKEKLKKWYEKWYAAYNGDNKLTQNEINDLRNEYNALIKEGADEVKALREQGVVKQINGNDQQSTYNSLEKWSYEQADDLINRATALQIIDENQYQILSQSLEVAYSTLSGVEGIRTTVQEIATAIAMTIELQEAANGKLDKIIANTNPIGEIRDLVKKLYNER